MPALVRYGVRVGIPSVMAALLVYWLTMKIDAKLENSQDMIRQHAAMSQAAIASITDRLERSDRMQTVVVNLLRAGCVNAAKSYDERNRCLAAGVSP